VRLLIDYQGTLDRLPLEEARLMLRHLRHIGGVLLDVRPLAGGPPEAGLAAADLEVAAR